MELGLSMKKALTGVYAMLAIVAGSAAVSAADPTPDPVPSEAAQSACPNRIVSVYFQQGQAAASPASEELISRISGAAVECRPARVDLVAHLDPSEGEDALRLALDRLSAVTNELTRRGVSALKIRIATQDASRSAEAGIPGRQVDILIRPTLSSAGITAPPPPPAMTEVPVEISSAI
jgi:outer membrane protein OmpA-like peptidoglycan-associated protein